jgi:hypothetical protein
MGLDKLLGIVGAENGDLTKEEADIALQNGWVVANFPDPDAPGDEKMAESLGAHHGISESDGKRTIASGADSKGSGHQDEESAALSRERDRQMVVSPLQSKSKAVQGFVLFGSRVFFNVWGSVRVESLYPHETVAVSDADLGAFDVWMKEQCEDEVSDAFTKSVVALHLRRHTIVGALAFQRRGQMSTSERFSADALIQTEVSVKEYNKLNDEASKVAPQIWSDQHAPAREALAIHMFTYKFGHEFKDVAASDEKFGKQYLILGDQLLDSFAGLAVTNVSMRPRRPVVTQLPRGFVVHHKGKYLNTDRGTFAAAVIVWLRVLKNEFESQLACGTSMKNLIVACLSNY